MIGAISVGSYIALAGLWGSPISGTSMNPARTFGSATWPAWTSPTTGSTSPVRSPAPVVAVLLAFVLRGYGGGRSGSEAAQGEFDTEVSRPDQT